jgi:cytoskeletal protein RodZ
MTTRDHARPADESARATPRLTLPRVGALRTDPDRPATGGEGGNGTPGGEPSPGRRSERPRRPAPAGPSWTATLPDRLLAARERRGVDLYRAERDTKIRAHYLAALERGDYRELPGAVYVKGFLRNYATYLGLDPEDVLEQWRRERGEAAVPSAAIAGPQPLVAPRPGLTFSPGLVVAALLTLVVIAFVAYLGVQLLRFAKPPTIAVSAPVEAVLEVDEETTVYTFAGTSIPGATVEIAATGREQPYRATADGAGVWTREVELSRGRNQFVVTAKDPDTGKAAEQPVERVIIVPFPEIAAPTLVVDSPTDGATFENGAIPVTGRVTDADEVTVTATWNGPEPAQPAASPGASPAPSVAPSPGASPSGPPPIVQTVEPAADGTFSVPLDLTTGAWSIVVEASSAQGKTVSVSRAVTVSYEGVNLVVTISGGRAWLKVWVDDKLAEGFGAGGKVIGDGRSVSFTGTTSVEVRTGNSGATRFTLNGQELGALGPNGIPETWRFAPPAPPEQTDRR